MAEDVKQRLPALWVHVVRAVHDDLAMRVHALHTRLGDVEGGFAVRAVGGARLDELGLELQWAFGDARWPDGLRRCLRKLRERKFIRHIFVADGGLLRGNVAPS